MFRFLITWPQLTAQPWDHVTTAPRGSRPHGCASRPGSPRWAWLRGGHLGVLSRRPPQDHAVRRRPGSMARGVFHAPALCSEVLAGGRESGGAPARSWVLLHVVAVSVGAGGGGAWVSAQLPLSSASPQGHHGSWLVIHSSSFCGLKSTLILILEKLFSSCLNLNFR